MPLRERLRLNMDFLGRRVLLYYLSALILGFALFAVETAFAFGLQGFLGAMGLAQQQPLYLPDWYPRGLAANTAMLVFLSFSRSLTNVAQGHCRNMVSQTFGTLQRNRILETSLEYPQSISLVDSVSLFSDLTQRASAGLNYMLAVVVNGVAAVCLAIAGLSMAPKEMLCGLAMLAVLTLPLRLLNRIVDDTGLGLSREWQAINARLINGLRHNFFLRVYGLLGQERRKGRASLRNYLSHYWNHSIISTLKTDVPLFMGVLVISAITYISLTRFGTSAAILISFFYLFLRLAQTLGLTLSSLTNFWIQLPALREIYARHLEAKTIRAATRLPRPLAEKERRDWLRSLDRNGVILAAKDIRFAYGEHTPPILDGISFTVSQGQVLVITGESGSGKSTLLSLSLGIYQANRGRLTVNGLEIYDAKSELYPYVGYAGPEPYLVAGTVRDILLYGNPAPASVNDEEMRESLKIAMAADFVEQLPEGLGTFIREDVQLSTGQKQRLAIARVLLRRPKLLVLDEFTANLDLETETALLDNLRATLRRTTTVVATHRPSLRALGSSHIHLN